MPARARIPCRREGFTLAEILVAAVFLIVILGVLAVAALNYQSSYLSMDALIQVSENARRALDAMTRELRSAGGAITTNAADYGSYVEFQTVLGFSRTDIAGCPATALCWGAFDANGQGWKDWKIRYQVTGSAATGGQLNRQVFDAGGTPKFSRVLATNIDGLASSTFFEWDSATSTITLHVQVATPNSAMFPGGRRSSGVLISRVELRNT